MDIHKFDSAPSYVKMRRAQGNAFRREQDRQWHKADRKAAKRAARADREAIVAEREDR